MGYLGYKPADKPLTSADITDSIITSAKIVDATIALADLSATGTKNSTTFLRGDNTFATVVSGILQVKHLTYTSTQTVSNNETYTEITGFNLSITPTSSSSKILVNMVVHGGSNNWSTGRLYRGGTAISGAKPADVSTRFGSTTAGMYRDNENQARPLIINYLDDPATTSSTTYSLAVSNHATGNTFYFNRSVSDLDYPNAGRYISTITLMEISSGIL